MDFRDFFTATSCLPDLEADDKLEAVESLVQVLSRYRRVTDGDEVLERVLEREALDSTGIGHGVAIPHARIPTIKKIVCAFARTTEALDFDSIDGKPVRLVFLILYPPAEAGRYLFIISTLTRMLLHDGLADRLLEASNDDLLEVLLQTADEQAEKHELDEATPEGETIRPPTQLNPDVARLIRLQRLEDQRPRGSRNNADLEKKIEHVRSCISAKFLKHYDKLRRKGGLAVVAGEAGICQGCHMQFGTAFAQELRETARFATCPNCSRYLYVLS